MPPDGRPADPPFVVVGHFSKPHGTKGEFYIWPLTDHPGTTFAPDVELLVSDAEGAAPDPLFEPLRVVEARPYQKGVLVRFIGIDDRTRADLFRDRYLMRPFEETEPLEDDEIFYHQLLGMTAVTPDGAMIGRVIEVYELRPVDMLEIAREAGTLLVPLTKEILVEWSAEEGRVVLNPPEGLLDL